MGIEHRAETDGDLTGCEMSAEELLQTVLRYQWKPHPERHGADGGSVFVLAALVILAGLVILGKLLIVALGTVLGW